MRHVILGSVTVLSLIVLAGCNQDTASDTGTADAQLAAVAPAPGSNGEAVSTQQGAAAGGVTISTEGFVEAAAMGDIYEIESSMIALDRAQSDDVREFAREMIDAHTMTTDEMREELEETGETIALPATLDAHHRGLIDNLRGAADEEFDARYIAQLIDAHNETFILMQGYAEGGENPELRGFAIDSMPLIEAHLERIMEIDRAHRDANAQTEDADR